MMRHEWEIKRRGERCARTGVEFAEGELIYALLFRDRGGFRREDWCLAAWEAEKERIKKAPFSFWKTKYATAAPAPETLPRANAETLLRRFLAAPEPGNAKARYILALMLERKRMLRHVGTEADETGTTLIYEHRETGEAFLIPDPHLRLDQIEAVQLEVASMLDYEES